MILGFKIDHAVRDGCLLLLAILACLPHANVDQLIDAADVVALNVQLVATALVKLSRKVAEVILWHLVGEYKFQKTQESANHFVLDNAFGVRVDGTGLEMFEPRLVIKLFILCTQIAGPLALIADCVCGAVEAVCLCGTIKSLLRFDCCREKNNLQHICLNLNRGV